MGGGNRGGRVSYAAVRDGGNRAYERDVGKPLSHYAESVKPRVFISFHIEDEFQVNLLRAQAKNPRFDVEFTDYSVKEPFDEKWKMHCEERIRQSSVLVVMIGPETHLRRAVLWEINKAYELGKPVIAVRIFRDKNHVVPEPLGRNGAKIVNWNMDEIRTAIKGEMGEKENT